MPEFDDLNDEVRACTRCELHHYRVQGVPGDGPKDAKIMLVGQAPGQAETEQGIPFVGQAGQYLDDLLEIAGISREDVHLCNVVCCPAPHKPTAEQIEACRPFLQRRIELIRPKVIVTLGQVALEAVFGGSEKISQVHGQHFSGRDYLIFATFNPAAGLHNSEKYQLLIEEDFRQLGFFLASLARDANWNSGLGRRLDLRLPGGKSREFLYLSPPEIQKSRVALEKYKRSFTTSPSFPWRLVRSKTTGLPFYLRGNAAEPAGGGDEIVIRVAQNWLDTEALSESLVADQEWSKFFPKPADLVRSGTRPTGSTPVPDQRLPQRFHVRHQQWHGEWPVRGGVLTLHATEGLTNISCTSGYLPVPQAASYTVKISEEEAKQIASRTVRSRYWNRRRIPVAQPGLAWRQHMLENQLPGRLPKTPRSRSQPANDPPDYWQTEVREYLGKKQFIFPFEGKYYLVYEAIIQAQDLSEVWSVFIDAENGALLGKPIDQLYQAFYYRSSQDAQDEILSDYDNLNNPCAAFMEVYVPQPSGTSPTSSTREKLTWPCNETQGVKFQASHLAINASRLHNYLIDDCGADPSKLDIQLLLKGCIVTTGSKTPCFSPVSQEIITPYHAGPRCEVKNEETGFVCFSPALDPEVIFHEVAHALMWRLNNGPFENVLHAAPYSTSILEGYATYFARSLAAKDNGETEDKINYWASKAYPPDADQWDTRWAFARLEVEPGQDRLEIPNLYPSSPSKMDLYDVGMIWARALWDLRRLVGAQISDQMALDAYHHAQGWVYSLEPVAEGLIEAAGRFDQEVLWNEALPLLFGMRGILAERGIQALGAHSQTIFAGTDSGLMRSTDGGDTWHDASEERVQSGTKLQGVVAITRVGSTWFVATDGQMDHNASEVDHSIESKIYKRSGSKWETVGNWENKGRIIGLAGTNDKLFVGTSQNVWWMEKNTNPPEWNAIGDLSHIRLALDITLGPQNEAIYVAGFDGIVGSGLGENSGWAPIHMPAGIRDSILCVAKMDSSIFFGTAKSGVLELNTDKVFVHGTAQNDRHGLPEAAVVCLALNNSKKTLYAGTSQGVYKGKRPTPAEAVHWEKMEGLPEHAVANRIISTGKGVFAGTALHGVFFWEYQQQAWREIEALRSITGNSLTVVSKAVPGSFPVSQPYPCGLFPFYLTETCAGISMTPPAAEIKLWSLEPMLRPVSSLSPSSQPLKPGLYILMAQGGITPTTYIISALS